MRLLWREHQSCHSIYKRPCGSWTKWAQAHLTYLPSVDFLPGKEMPMGWRTQSYWENSSSWISLSSSLVLADPTGDFCKVTCKLSFLTFKLRTHHSILPFATFWKLGTLPYAAWWNIYMKCDQCYNLWEGLASIMECFSAWVILHHDLRKWWMFLIKFDKFPKDRKIDFALFVVQAILKHDSDW